MATRIPVYLLLLLCLALGCSPAAQSKLEPAAPASGPRPRSAPAQLPKLPASYRSLSVGAGTQLVALDSAKTTGVGERGLGASAASREGAWAGLSQVGEPAPSGASARPPARCDLPSEKLPHGIYRDDAHSPGELALTFDDGPHISHTPRVLKLLAERDLSATFFVVGRNIRSNTYHLLQEMVRAGHSLGSHSYNHDVEMSLRDYGTRSVEYIQGQHETTQILIDLALMARSQEDFRELYQRVFGVTEARYLSGGELRADWPRWQARHFELLAERGFAGVTRESDSGRPYPVVYSRPPGGGPYLGSALNFRQLNDRALARVGLLNVLWHDGAGDTSPGERHDARALYTNLMRSARRGGVVLIHDYIRKDALARALDSIQAAPGLSVVSLDSLMLKKYACSPAEIRVTLMAGREASN